jgi:hypothetical protein
VSTIGGGKYCKGIEFTNASIESQAPFDPATGHIQTTRVSVASTTTNNNKFVRRQRNLFNTKASKQYHEHFPTHSTTPAASTKMALNPHQKNKVDIAVSDLQICYPSIQYQNLLLIGITNSPFPLMSNASSASTASSPPNPTT